MTTATATSKAKKTATPFSAPIAEIHLVPLDLIDVHDQVRTTFDQESIEELARDIEARGLMQPVLLNPDPNNGRFTMIAGERRLRAIKHNGQAAIPALITKASADEVLLMQLAENVQREELSLEDECKAIAKLYEMLGSLKVVSEKVKKSVPWCSKRFAMSQTDLHWQAKVLLENGHTEDIELLKAASKLFELKSVGWKEIQEWTEKIIKGEAGRNEIRAALKAEKEKAKQEKAKQETTEKVSHAKVKAPPPPPAWTLDNALDDLDRALTWKHTETRGIELFNSWTKEQQKQVEARLDAAKAIGASEDGFKIIGKLVMHGLCGTEYTNIDLIAMIAGIINSPISGIVFTPTWLLEQLQGPKEKA